MRCTPIISSTEKIEIGGSPPKAILGKGTTRPSPKNRTKLKAKGLEV
jgi:hypothetical protein